MKLSEVGKATPVRTSTTLCLDGQAAARFDELVRAANAAINRGNNDQAKSLAAQIETLASEIKTVECFFEKLEGDGFDELVDKCAPSEAQRERGERFDTAKLRPLLVKAAMVDPEPDDTFDAWWASLNWGQKDRLYTAALDANTESIDIPFVRAASESIRILTGTSATADRRGSRSRSSAGGESKRSRSTNTTKRAASSDR